VRPFSLTSCTLAQLTPLFLCPFCVLYLSKPTLWSLAVDNLLTANSALQMTAQALLGEARQLRDLVLSSHASPACPCAQVHLYRSREEQGQGLSLSEGVMEPLLQEEEEEEEEEEVRAQVGAPGGGGQAGTLLPGSSNQRRHRRGERAVDPDEFTAVGRSTAWPAGRLSDRRRSLVIAQGSDALQQQPCKPLTAPKADVAFAASTVAAPLASPRSNKDRAIELWRHAVGAETFNEDSSPLQPRSPPSPPLEEDDGGPADTGTGRTGGATTTNPVTMTTTTTATSTIIGARLPTRTQTRTRTRARTRSLRHVVDESEAIPIKRMKL
jgi:hypothetical protein